MQSQPPEQLSEALDVKVLNVNVPCSSFYSFLHKSKIIIGKNISIIASLDYLPLLCPNKLQRASTVKLPFHLGDALAF